MDETNLLLVCLNAFIAVLILLSFFAGIMRLLITLFPEKKTASDNAIASAIDAAVREMLPGARVVRVEEIKRGSP
ncbi:MAG TPA: hypothetical protein PJ991_05525 [Kiritimatiellia bacterium]|nr:hypothetical protein [Kiritimatiellia bacterium]